MMEFRSLYYRGQNIVVNIYTDYVLPTIIWLMFIYGKYTNIAMSYTYPRIHQYSNSLCVLETCIWNDASESYIIRRTVLPKIIDTLDKQFLNIKTIVINEKVDVTSVLRSIYRHNDMSCTDNLSVCDLYKISGHKTSDVLLQSAHVMTVDNNVIELQHDEIYRPMASIFNSEGQGPSGREAEGRGLSGRDNQGLSGRDNQGLSGRDR